MSRRAPTRPDLEAELSDLKGFQRRGVECAFGQLRDGHSRRFLVADEVGLGKTHVARGVIAKMVDYLWERERRIDVVYICSNQELARQNLTTLRPKEAPIEPPSRITLLPLHTHEFRSSKINLFAFTPGTMPSPGGWQSGIKRERALLYRMLQEPWRLGRRAAERRLFQAQAGEYGFADELAWVDSHTLDKRLARQFVAAVRRTSLRSEFEELARPLRRRNLNAEETSRRNRLLGELRAILARVCVDALEPDLIILDEFQRFRRLLREASEASELAHAFLSHEKAHVLLLSATPYRMLSLAHEGSEEDHYADFTETLRFLFADETAVRDVEALLAEFRAQLLAAGANRSRLRATKEGLEARLRTVMARTERLAMTPDRDGMLAERPINGLKLEASDAIAYVAAQRAARLVGRNRRLHHLGTLEYWKSAPYLFNFMESYQLKAAFREALADRRASVELADLLRGADSALLDWSAIENYDEVDLGNARLRALAADTVGAGLWQLLWVAPTLPHHELAGVFSAESAKHATKRLVFSSWAVAPKAAATLLSYEAERQMVIDDDEAKNTTADRQRRSRGLLAFEQDERERLTGMPVFALIYPSPTLACDVDPYRLARSEDALPSAADVLRDAERRVREMLAPLTGQAPKSGRVDQRWYWAAPLLLDLTRFPDLAREVFDDPADTAWYWSIPVDDPDAEHTAPEGWVAHVREAARIVAGDEALGRVPGDLARVIASFAVAAPGVCALRSLRRLAEADAQPTDELLDHAAAIGWAFRLLFNGPEATAMIRSTRARAKRAPYWRQVLGYCHDGCLQAVLDEYVHLLAEQLRPSSGETGAQIEAVVDHLWRALGLRATNLAVDVIEIADADGERRLHMRDGERMRCRFALPFGQGESEDARVVRREQVRNAFNSPFWPWVLVSTSIGQEGLDFHRYCHAVVHWNIPTNPVDLEQREGRVHRYKGHAIRRNLVRSANGSAIADLVTDPWATLFAAGASEENDLIPFWIAAGPFTIDRYVPALPYTRDAQRFEKVKRMLTLYRLVLGQARQEDLLEALMAECDEDEALQLAQELRLNLSPAH